MSDIQKHLEVSQRVALDDLDWNVARQYGVTECEADCLSFFADVESQTVHYFMEAAKLKIDDADMLAFLTMWNYEEYFHAHAITRLLSECGVSVPEAKSRTAEVRAGARFKARFEDLVQTAIAKLNQRAFIALWMTWGSTQELLTSHAYEQIAADTANPVTRELCRRIAKQERRHFAYYYGRARSDLEASRAGQHLTRLLLKKVWSPVGNGVKTPQATAELARSLFPGARFAEVLRTMDSRISVLPGMEGLSFCQDWARRMDLYVEPAQADSGATSHAA